MVRRQIARTCGLAWGATTSRSASSAPTVYDKVVSFMCVKEDGNRVMIKGYEGDSLGKTLARANLLNKKNSCENHWMPEEMDVHVILSQEWANQLPAATEEERTVLRRIARGEAIRDTSRVASYIKIEPSSDGMFLAIGPADLTEFLNH